MAILKTTSTGCQVWCVFWLLVVARVALERFLWRKHAQRDARALLGQLRAATSVAPKASESDGWRVSQCRRGLKATRDFKTEKQEKFEH